MRILALSLALGLAVVLTAAAVPPVTTFPATFANHERIVAVGVVSGHGIWRRNVQRGTNDDVFVFDDATRFHIDDAGTTGPAITGTWRTPSRRVVAFTFSPEVVAALKDSLSAEVPFPVNVKCGNGRLNFGRLGAAYSGTQVIRCSGRYRGFVVSIVETMYYSGRAQSGKTQTAAGSGTMTGVLADVVARLAARLHIAAARVR